MFRDNRDEAVFVELAGADCVAPNFILEDDDAGSLGNVHAAFFALDPFFDIVWRGLAGLVAGDHYFDTIAPDAVFEFRYRFPGWPTELVGREALMALYAGYGEGMALHGAVGRVTHRSTLVFGTRP